MPATQTASHETVLGLSTHTHDGRITCQFAGVFRNTWPTPEELNTPKQWYKSGVRKLIDSSIFRKLDFGYASYFRWSSA